MASEKQNPLITEELKNIVFDYECTPRFYPAFSIWVEDEGCIDTFAPNETEKLFKYIENMDLNEYKYEDGKKQTVELIWEMDGNNCDTLYTIQKGDDEDDLSDTSDTEELDEYLNR